MWTFSLPTPHVHSNRAHSRRVSMPSCNDMNYKNIRKMTAWKIFFIVYSITSILHMYECIHSAHWIKIQALAMQWVSNKPLLERHLNLSNRTCIYHISIVTLLTKFCIPSPDNNIIRGHAIIRACNVTVIAVTVLVWAVIPIIDPLPPLFNTAN